MNLTREQLFRHLHSIHDGEPGWEESAKLLLAEGEEVVPFLIEIIGIEQEKAREAVVLGYNKLLRVVELLAEFRHPWSLGTFLTLAPRIARPTVSNRVYSLFRQVLGVVGRRAESEDIRALLELMQRARPRWTGTTLLVEFLPRETVLIATTLVSIAEREPTPELRAALPLLKPHPLLPWELVALRRRLKAALPEENLPIPASQDEAVPKDLPIPDAGGLPK